MTLCVGWIRKLKDADEICLAADSCFSSGQRFYAAPKIFPLSRGDCAIACAGSTTYSLPVVEHITRAIELNGPIHDRSYDYLDIIHLIEDITNKCLFEEQEVQLDSKEGPDFSMIIAGYSWRIKGPRLFVLKYNKHEKKMRANRVTTLMKTEFAVIGDTDVISPFRRRVYKVLESEGVQPGMTIDDQPLRVLMSVINDKKNDTIAGYPQMVKIYPFMRVLPIGFYYPKTGNLYFYGRPLLNYETFPYPIYNVDDRSIKYMKTTVDEFKRSPEEIQTLEKKFQKI